MRKQIQTIDESFIVPKSNDGHIPNGIIAGDYIKVLDDTCGDMRRDTYYMCSNKFGQTTPGYIRVDPTNGKLVKSAGFAVPLKTVGEAIRRNSWAVLNYGETIPNDIEGFKEMFVKLVDNLGITKKLYLKPENDEWKIGITETMWAVDSDEMFGKITKVLSKRGIETKKYAYGLQVTKIPV